MKVLIQERLFEKKTCITMTVLTRSHYYKVIPSDNVLSVYLEEREKINVQGVYN